MKPETREKYRKCLIDLYSKIKHGETIRSSEWSVKNAISPMFFAALKDAKIIEKEKDIKKKNTWKWIETKQIYSSGEAFFKLADIMGDIIEKKNEKYRAPKIVVAIKETPSVPYSDINIINSELTIMDHVSEFKGAGTQEKPIQIFHPDKQINSIILDKVDSRIALLLLSDIQKDPNYAYCSKIVDNMANQLFESLFS